MSQIEVAKYLTDYNRQTNYSKCKLCDKRVQWSKERLAAHKRSSCPNASLEEKRLFSKRKSESPAHPSTSSQNEHTQPMQASQELLSHVADTTNGEWKADVDMKLSNYFYRTGVSLRLVESDAFKDFVNALNPAYAAAMPSAKTLSGPLLDMHVNKCSAAVDEIIQSHGNLTLMSDGWTNIRGDHIVNFCVKAPGQKAIFYSSIDTSGIIQNSVAVAAAIIQVIDKIGSQKFCSFISDNAPVMKSSWKIINETYPHISASGCSGHGINLLIKDIAITTEAAKTIKESEKIIKFIKNHHMVKLMFDEYRRTANVT
ncbi:uncharacterized protein LOC101238619 [Hydra vulgaris]|uniref:uncharacterized protein LOC101238619 n=1 Tax=Hydra vulgaris TaxID=6087 RepID=UPI0002B4725F|nr:uncharacterized protein LOC101238619 [Hydra vulgaris]